MERKKKETEVVKQKVTKTKKRTKKEEPLVEEKTIEIKKEEVVNNKVNNTKDLKFVKYLCFLLAGITIGLLISILLKNIRNNKITGNSGDAKYDSLYQAYSTIKENYYKDVDDNTLINGAISGMLSSLGDPHTMFFDENSKEEFETQLAGQYYGIGAEIIQKSEEEVQITKVFDDSPAKKVGLEIGDIFVSIDGKSAKGMTVLEVATTLKSKDKDKATVVVKRNDEELTFEIEKDIVTLLSVSSEMLDDNVGYISISLFGSLTNSQFEKALKDLEEKGIKSLIIDLRDNSGGYLATVTEILSKFVNKDTVLYQMKTKDNIEKFYSKTDETKDFKVVILVNEMSASASEIMASCMQEQYGATLVGKKTYGKGSVQETEVLKNNTLIKYTVQEWLTSKGKSINGEGVEPDVEVELSEEYNNNAIRENDNQLQKAIEIIKE
ncbi:MAG: S41 family peptidase [Bacilli bacterium]|nr:S41 family peptidase [Bacilli bacterium]